MNSAVERAEAIVIVPVLAALWLASRSQRNAVRSWPGGSAQNLVCITSLFANSASRCQHCLPAWSR